MSPGTPIIYAPDPDDVSFDFDEDPLEAPKQNVLIYRRTPPIRNGSGEMFFHIFLYEGGQQNGNTQRADRKRPQFQDPVIRGDDRIIKVTGLNGT